MPGSPDASELLGAVRDFIAGLPLDGRDAFHAKVAANVLAIVMRELAERPEVAEARALAGLISRPSSPLLLTSSPRTRGPKVTSFPTLGLRLRGDDSVEVEAVVARESTVCYNSPVPALTTAICHALRDGTLTLATPGLLDALITATTARLAVDNPRYSTLARLRSADPPQPRSG